MSWELYYTSAERGVNPHSRGFCTVARSEGMPAAVIERLESLSNYSPVYPAGSERAGRNPVAWSHWRIPLGARTRSVLSRVAFVASDHSGRAGKFAHHVLLEPSEQSPVGPIAMMRGSDAMQDEWDAEPMMLPARIIEMAASTAPPNASGEAWPARLAEAFMAEPERPAYVIYEAGTDLLPMLGEAVALLPMALRWQVTFSTYFTELPAGLACAWRCVPAGTPAVAAARAAQGLTIDLAAGNMERGT
jgi:hypothetical protein